MTQKSTIIKLDVQNKEKKHRNAFCLKTMNYCSSQGGVALNITLEKVRGEESLLHLGCCFQCEHKQINKKTDGNIVGGAQCFFFFCCQDVVGLGFMSSEAGNVVL